MKLILVFAVVALAAGASAYTVECVRQTGVLLDSALGIRLGNFSDSSAEAKCFAKCVLEKAGFMSGQGELLEKKVLEKLRPKHGKARIEGALKKCATTTTADAEKGSAEAACETGFKVFRCFYENKAALV